jgi:hypothetical protein
VQQNHPATYNPNNTHTRSSLIHLQGLHQAGLQSCSDAAAFCCCNMLLSLLVYLQHSPLLKPANSAGAVTSIAHAAGCMLLLPIFLTYSN